MSAPNTNVKKQERRHKTPLVGMAAMIGWAAALLIALIAYLVLTGNEPADGTPVDAEQEAAEQNAASTGGANGEQEEQPAQ